MVHDPARFMQSWYRGDVPIRVPEGPGQRELAAVVLGHQQYVAPGRLLLVADVHVVYGNALGPGMFGDVRCGGENGKSP